MDYKSRPPVQILDEEIEEGFEDEEFEGDGEVVDVDTPSPRRVKLPTVNMPDLSRLNMNWLPTGYITRRSMAVEMFVCIFGWGFYGFILTREIVPEFLQKTVRYSFHFYVQTLLTVILCLFVAAALKANSNYLGLKNAEVIDLAGNPGVTKESFADATSACLMESRLYIIGMSQKIVTMFCVYLAYLLVSAHFN